MTTAVIHFITRHRITLPNREHWYVCLKQLPGHVNALNNLRGIPRITNGIDMYIETSEGQVVMVHREWFVYDDPEVQKAHNMLSDGKTAMERKVAKLLADLLG